MWIPYKYSHFHSNIEGSVAECHFFLHMSIQYIHSFIESPSYNTLIHHHCLRSLSRSSSPWVLRRKNLPGVTSREFNSFLPYSKLTRYQLSYAASLLSYAAPYSATPHPSQPHCTRPIYAALFWATPHPHNNISREDNENIKNVFLNFRSVVLAWWG